MMRRLSDRFGDLANECATLGDLSSLLADASRELGFSYYALLHHASLIGAQDEYIRLDNYPSGWAAEFVRAEYAIEDPVHLASRCTNAGFRWSELDRLIAPRRSHRLILSRSRSFGLGEGFTIPANVPGEPSGSCSFALRAGHSLSQERLPCAELIGAHAFRAARRIHPLPARPKRPHLSRREIQCLRLVAMGKTDWEIARILGIGRETARQYVKRARSAYDVVSRTQLAVLGLRDQWVQLEELFWARTTLED